MQTQNNNNFMKSITGETKYFTTIPKYELKAEAFILLDTIFSFLSENRHYSKRLIFKTSNNSSHDFDFCQDRLFPKPIAKLEIIRKTISNIIDSLPGDYNEITRIMIVLYY